MKMRCLTTAVAAVGLATTLAATDVSTASAQETKVSWTMGSTFPSRLVQLGSLGVKLSENVAAVSGGEIELEFFEPGALAPALEYFDAIAAGAIDSAWSTSGYWRSKEEALALFAAVPFGPAAGEYAGWIYYGGGHEILDEIYAQHGLKALICGVIAPEASGWFREEINSVEDLAGLKMRFYGLGAKVMQKLGVDTQLLAGADIYPALERGTIDATEFSMPAIDLDLGFYQVASHYYFPGWHQQSTLFELLMNKEKWDALSDKHKAQLEMACKANFLEGLAEGEAIQAQALIELQEKGVTIHRWSPEMLETFENAWNEVAAELAASDANFKKAWDSLQAFREDYAVWAELGYLN